MALWIVISLLALLLIFVAVLVVRALLFTPPVKPTSEVVSVTINRDKVVADLADMIGCKTVSHRDATLIDEGEFERFRDLLVQRFPLIHATCSLEHIGKNGLLYCLKGQSSSRPSVLMAHYDVVPAVEEDWDKPAFAGIVEDGYIWGRGTLDTKGTLCGIFEALEQALSQGYLPQNDLYLSFSGEEEIDGGTCEAIVTHLEQQGVVPALVLDEGGAVVENVFPGVSGQCALIGIGEKGGVNLQFTLESNGGHASTPPVHTVMGDLSRAVTRIERHPFRRRLTTPVKAMFDTLGRHSTFVYRLIFANLWCFAPLLDWICKRSGGELNAMMRTTVAVTRMQGSDAYNVLPPKGSFGINMRLMAGDTIASATDYLKQVVGDHRIQIERISGMEASPCSVTDCEEYEKLTAAIGATWPQAVISPYLMMACSDSRHYCRISDKVYRFSAMRLSKEERGMIHGNNERVPIDTLLETVAFYSRLLQLL